MRKKERETPGASQRDRIEEAVKVGHTERKVKIPEANVDKEKQDTLCCKG